MKPSEKKLISVALLLNRIFLGLLFLFAGLRKIFPFEKVESWGTFFTWSGLIDILKILFSYEAIGQKLTWFASFSADKAPLPELLGKAYGYALPWTELVVGVTLAIGFFSRLSAILIGLMLLSFLIAMGPEWWPQQGPAFSKNFILLTLCLLIAATGSGRFAYRPDGPHK